MRLDFWYVAVYELGEATRTRLFQLAALAYLGGMGFSSWLLARILREMETGLAATMGLPPTERPGALMNELLASGQLVDLVAGLVGERANAEALLREPVAGLWAGGFAMGLLPLVLLLTSSGSIASEVASRSIRYLACRTDRLSIGLGKLLGQLAVGAVCAVLGVVLVMVLTQVLTVGTPPLALLGSLTLRSAAALVYALPWAGVGLAVSQWVAHPNGARVVAGLVFGGSHVAAGLIAFGASEGPVARVLDMLSLFLVPTLWTELWVTTPADLALSAGRAVLLALVWYAVGHARFLRRDL